MSEKGLDCGCHSISIVSPLCSQSRTWVLRSKQGSLISALTNPAAQHPRNFLGSGSMAGPVRKTCCKCCFPLSFSSFLLSSTWASEAELAPCLCIYPHSACFPLWRLQGIFWVSSGLPISLASLGQLEETLLCNRDAFLSWTSLQAAFPFESLQPRQPHASHYALIKFHAIVQDLNGDVFCFRFG